MLKGSFNTSSLFFERISMPLFGLYCLIFFLDQIHLGETLVTPGFHVVTMFVYAISINMLMGIKTLAGLMVFMYAFSSVGAFSLSCLISRSAMSSLIDAEQELIMLNLCASVVIMLASFIFSKLNFGDPVVSKFLPLINQTDKIPKSTAALITLTVLAIFSNLIQLSGEVYKFTSVLTPIVFLVGWTVFQEKKTGNIALICMLLVVAAIWSSAGLSGMKSSLLLPLIALVGAAAMVGAQLKRMAALGFVILFVFVSVIAFAIQPLRNIKFPMTSELIIKLALAYIVFDVDKRYDLQLDFGDRELRGIVDRIAEGNRSVKKGSSAGILTRMSFFEDDSKMVEAVRQKGQIPLDKYFEEVILVPRSISGKTDVTDRLSAFHGRYAEILGRFDTSTGIAFSGHILSYAHGGYLYMLSSMFISTILTFILVTVIFGRTIQQSDLASLFAIYYISGIDQGLSLLGLWHLFTRAIPVIILAYAMLYYLIRLLSELSGNATHVRSETDARH